MTPNVSSRSLNRRSMTGTVVTLAACMALAACGSDSNTAASSDEPQTSTTTIADVEISPNPDLYAEVPDKYKDAGKVKVASSFPYPPWELYDGEESEENLVGIEADLVHAVGVTLGVPFEFNAVDFDGLIPAVQSGTYDVLASALHDTVERQKALTFVDYLNVGSAFLVKKGNPDGVTDLLGMCGRKLVVQASSAQLGYVTEFQEECEAAGSEPIETVIIPEGPAAILAVKTGKGEAYFSDKVALSYVAESTNSGNDFEVLDDPQAAAGYNASPVGLGVRTDNNDLAEVIQKAVQELMDSGDYLEIMKKNKADFGAIEEAAINGATE